MLSPEMKYRFTRLFSPPTFIAACAAFLFFVPCTFSAGETRWQIAVLTDRVVYLPDSPGQAEVTITAPDDWPADLTLRSTLEYGLNERQDLPDLPITQSAGRTVSIPFLAPSDAWGCAMNVQLVRGDEMLAAARDVFAVGTNAYRLGQQSNHGGALAGHRVREFKGKDSYYTSQWRSMKGTWLEIFGHLPSEVVGLTTEWDEWISMQGRYRASKATIRAYIESAHDLGMKVMMYNNATPSGWVGTRWARKHPEWLSYTYMGNLRADMNVEDIEKQKQWHKTLQPHTTTYFHPLYLNFNNQGMIEFACDQMLGACEMFGYDGVRFDGHWIIGDVWSGIGYAMDGRRPNRGKSVDAVSTRILDDMKNYTWAGKPDFNFGYNYGPHYESGGARNPRSYRKACANDGMILWEGSTFDDAYSDLRVGALKLRENALRVHQNGGVHYGQAYMIHTDLFSSNEFALRYFFIANFAATSHIYAGVYPNHQFYQPIQGLYFRFALRYGEILFDRGLQPVLNSGDYLSVTASGKVSDDLWWKPYMYKRQLDGRYQLITHLVNMPASGVNKKNSTPDKQPPPIENVSISLKKKPLQSYLLDPEAAEWQREFGDARKISIPSLKAWKILVQEFDGNADHITVERIPEGDFADQDKLLDPKNSRIVIPINYFITGAGAGQYYSTDIAGTQLVDDPAAEFGFSLRCSAATIHEPTGVVNGPNHSMPISAPGRIRAGFRLKVADNTSAETVCRVEGRFGQREIKANEFRLPGVFQEFAYDYTMQEDVANRLNLDYYGGTDLWIDRIDLQQLAPAIDHEFFDARSLQVEDLPAREGPTRRAHLVRGLWHDFFGLDDALARADIEITESWEKLSTNNDSIPVGLPVTAEEFAGYDFVALLNVGAASLMPVRRKHIREYVMRGGTLFVGGGARAFGHGGYANTFLEEILPVTMRKFDLTAATGDDQLITKGEEDRLTAGLLTEDPPRVAFYHDVEAKPDGKVLLKAGSAPILTVANVGRGKVYAMTGSPMGEIDLGAAWWNCDDWWQIVDRILADASPNQPTVPLRDADPGFALRARIAGTEGLTMIDQNGDRVEPLMSEGVTTGPSGIDFGYTEPGTAPIKLRYPAGLIKPHGSISFKITPGFESTISEITRSVNLFSTKAADGTYFQIYLFVYPMPPQDVSIAMACYVRSKDDGADDFADHFARYGILHIQRGGLRMLHYTTWKKGEEREVKVRWSPTQMVLWDNGERMASGDFVPRMNLNSLTGPLYIGSNEGGSAARVKMRDIEIRGRE